MGQERVASAADVAYMQELAGMNTNLTEEQKIEILDREFKRMQEVAAGEDQPVQSEEDATELEALLRRVDELCKKNNWPVAVAATGFVQNPENEKQGIAHAYYLFGVGSKAARAQLILQDSKIMPLWEGFAEAFKEAGIIKSTREDTMVEKPDPEEPDEEILPLREEPAESVG